MAELPPDTAAPPVTPPPAPPGTPVNLIDPKLVDRALKRLRGIIRGNGVPEAEVKVELVEALVHSFSARTQLKLAPLYGIRPEPGQNRIAELATTLEDFNHKLATLAMEARTIPERREAIVSFLFDRPDKGFGIKDHKVKFHKLLRHLVRHEGCITCSKNGRIRCQKCSGDGLITCNLCLGRRTIVCPQCRSTGKVMRGNTHRSCDRCDGEGRIPCTRCRGIGQIKCVKCAAKGARECEKCAGSGWISHLATIEMEAKIHFDFDRQVLPLEVTNMIEAFGSRLVEKGDVEVVLKPTPMTQEELQRTEEPPDTIFVDYHAKVPHGPIQFRIRDRIIAATLFGYHGKLIEAPAFLDDLTRKGQQALEEAANGKGQAADLIRRAGRYRLLCDILLQAAGKASQKQSLDILTNRYPTGIGRDRLLALLLQSQQALRRITRLPMLLGGAAGLALFTTGLAAYYLSGTRYRLEMSGIPGPALTALDAVFFGVGTVLATGAAKMAARIVQTSLLSSMVPQGLAVTGFTPKAQRSVWIAAGGTLLVMAALLAYLALRRPDLAPPWSIPLIHALMP